MQAGNAAKEQAILRHGIVDAGSGENQTIAAAEGGNHDSDGHQGSAGGRSNQGLASGEHGSIMTSRVVRIN